MATTLHIAEFSYKTELNQKPEKINFKSLNFSKFKSHLKNLMISMMESYDDVMFVTFHYHAEQLDEDGIFWFSQLESEKHYDKIRKIYNKYEKLADDNHVKKILTK